MTLHTDVNFPTEIQDVAKLFFEEVTLGDDGEISLTQNREGDVFTYTATMHGKTCTAKADVCGIDQLQSVRLQKRYAKIALYNLLKDVTGREMPWGSLTGIRPTKLACQLQSEGLDWQQTFVNLLGVSPQKTQLVADILQCQGSLRNFTDTADLYVGIPFCVTRCSYCSFTSGEIERMKKYVQP